MGVYDNIFQRGNIYNAYYVEISQINCCWPKVRTIIWHVFMTIRIPRCLKESI